jgi:hypothetical protein
VSGSKNFINVLNLEVTILNSQIQRTMFKSTKIVFCERHSMDCLAVTYGAEFPVEDGKNDYVF